MIEFHGWFVLRHSPGDVEPDDTNLIAGELSTRIASIARDRIAGIQWNNGVCCLWLAGCSNRWTAEIDEIFQLLEFMRIRAPGSYGLMYLWDDQSEQPNEFQVWRLARGELSRHDDPFLSPLIPTIEEKIN